MNTRLVTSWNFDVSAWDVPIPPVKVGPAEFGVVASVKPHVVDHPPENGLDLCDERIYFREKCNYVQLYVLMYVK